MHAGAALARATQRFIVAEALVKLDHRLCRIGVAIGVDGEPAGDALGFIAASGAQQEARIGGSRDDRAIRAMVLDGTRECGCVSTPGDRAVAVRIGDARFGEIECVSEIGIVGRVSRATQARQSPSSKSPDASAAQSQATYACGAPNRVIASRPRREYSTYARLA